VSNIKTFGQAIEDARMAFAKVGSEYVKTLIALLQFLGFYKTV
jgi:hypothetical protein